MIAGVVISALMVLLRHKLECHRDAGFANSELDVPVELSTNCLQRCKAARARQPENVRTSIVQRKSSRPSGSLARVMWEFRAAYSCQ